MQLELGLLVRPSSTTPAGPARGGQAVVARPPAPTAPSSPVLEDLVAAYVLAALDNPHSRRLYRANLLRAIRTMQVVHLAEITLPRLAAYRATLTSSPLAAASQSLCLSALRGFLAWAPIVVGLPAGVTLDSVRATLRLPRVTKSVVPEILADDQVAPLLASADVGRGELAMLLVFLGTGLREAELCALDCDDIIELPGGIHALRVVGKRHKERVVPLRPSVLEAILEYLRLTGRRVGDDGPLFLAHDAQAHLRASRRLGTRRVRHRVQKLARRAGVGRVHAHGLRHTFATNVVRNGGRIHALAQLMGHESIETTFRYFRHAQTSELVSAIPDPIPPGPNQP